MKNLLKHSNLNSTEYWEDYGENELDNTPVHLSYRFNLDKCNKIKDSWEDKWEDDHTHDKYWQQCKRINALLDKCVGKSFDEVYSKVCNEYPKLIRYGKSLRDYFKEQFEIPKYRGSYYYIDENGLIQYKEYKRNRRAHVYTSYLDKKPEYRVNHDEIQNHTSLMNTIYYAMGKEAYYRLLDSETISEKFYNDLKAATHYDEGMNKIIDKLIWVHEWDKNLHKFDYRQKKAEDEDYKKKLNRERKHEREEYLNNLVQYITWKRNNEGREDDIQNRDRHGFDDKSFKNQ